MGGTTYEIRAAGEVASDVLEDFDVLAIRVDASATTIRAFLKDDAELGGLLEAINRAGYVLLEVQREVFESPAEGPWDGPGDHG